MTSLDPAMKLSDKALATAKQIVANYGHDPEGLLVGAIAGAIQTASPAPSSDLVERLTGENPERYTVVDRLRCYSAMPDIFEFEPDDAVELDELILEAATDLTAKDARIAELEGAHKSVEYALTKASLCEAEKIDDALGVTRRALASIREAA